MKTTSPLWLYAFVLFVAVTLSVKVYYTEASAQNSAMFLVF